MTSKAQNHDPKIFVT